MEEAISKDEAQLALRMIHDQQREVIAHVGLPRWYWWGVAAAWVAIGVISDLGQAWVALGATFLFGVAHSAVAQRIFSGRRASRQLTVRAGVVDRHLPLMLFGALIAMGAVTVGLGFLADADGAEHASTFASVIVAIAIVGLGPQVLTAVRRRAQRNLDA